MEHSKKKMKEVAKEIFMLLLEDKIEEVITLRKNLSSKFKKKDILYILAQARNYMCVESKEPEAHPLKHQHSGCSWNGKLLPLIPS